MDNKIDLRVKAKVIRKELDIANKSKIAVKLLRESSFYKNAKNVLLFYPMKYELNLLELLEDDKKFFLPKVDGVNISICPFSKGDNLIKSELNIYEPCSNPENPENIDLIVAPALLADKNNYRLGYGGGFYDRFLAKYPEISTVVLVAEELFVESLPHDDFDMKVDCVIKC